MTETPISGNCPQGFMANILIIAYTFAPFNGVGSNRPVSWLRYFSRCGLHPIVLTRHWEGLDSTDETTLPLRVEDTVEGSVFYFPYVRRLYKAYDLPLIGKCIELSANLFGLVTAERDVVPFARAFLKLPQRPPVDYVLATCLPLSSLRAGVILAEKMGVPLILDFRDIWDNRMLNPSFRANWRYSILIRIWEMHIRRWLRKADLVTVVTEAMVEHIRRLHPEARIRIIANGYDETMVPVHQARPNKRFTFSVIGSLLPHQDFTILLEGLHIFLKGKDLKEIRCQFVGSAIYPSVKKLLEDRLPSQCVEVTERIPQAEALQLMNDSDVLFYIGWRGYKGLASGKIYEYLGARRNILVAPGDNDVIDALLLETGAGKTANTPEDFAEILQGWFDEWKERGVVAYAGDDSVVKKYSRRYQAQRLAAEILGLRG